ncbi:rho-related GTP-binding protein RhoE-like [Limulus polyphemus]|uniref:Rho-related GTP-binding protein RhoE-like n=1 Tax=Limulus polyphemus TaxID=6850 RepID=A0ABM1BGB8_LIMPO|nr:rho-related GTP-binding protein RhoE-like [Limulus polyphemus]
MEKFSCKIVLVGDSRCGKTALIHRFTNDNFLEVYTPTGFERYTTSYEVGDYTINFTVWDTSGARAYNTVRPLAYKDANVFFLCFFISEPDSLENTVYRWYPEVRDHSPNVPVLLCGCQSDLRTDSDTLTSLAKRKKSPVSSEQALVVSRQIGATTYVETSSRLSGRSVQDAFEVASLAALGKLNKSHVAVPRHSALVKSKYKSKLDLKDDFRDRTKNCILM